MILFDANEKHKRTIESGEEEKIIQMIQEALQPFYASLHGYKVILFGSRVTGKKRVRSDYDLGVFGKKSLPEKIFFSIEDALERLPTLHKIDWVDLNQVNGKFIECALKNAKVLFE
jgi:predicted nucleotidyltransferase